MNPLTPEYVNQERIRCRESFLHFIESHCMIQDRKSGSEIPFLLWPGQVEVLGRILYSTYLVALKARQLGITWLISAFVLWRSMFRFNELAIVISGNEDLAVEFLDRVKFMFDRLPEWLKPRVYKRSTTELTFGYEIKDAAGNVKIEGMNSTIKSIPSTPAAGQSKTISLLVMDESALNRYCKDIWGSAKPTLEHAGGQAIIISNPSKTMPGWSWTRDLYTKSMRGENEFERIFLNWKCVPGRGDDFLDLQRSAGLDDDDIVCQYPSTEEEAISTLGGSYFGSTIAGFESFKGEIGRIEKQIDGAYRFIPDQTGILEVWDLPKGSWDHRYAIGSDVSEGLGETYSVAYVYDRLTNEYVARMRANKVSADLWADRLMELGFLYRNAMIGPERNGAGITTVMHLQSKNYPNIYFRKRPGKLKGQYVMEYGWLETEENKQILADELKRHFRDVFKRVPCPVLIEECSTFIRHENGKLAHEEGKKDDCVIAAGIALQVSQMMPTVKDNTPDKPFSWVDARIDMLDNGASGDDFEDWMHEEMNPNRRNTPRMIHDANLVG